MKRGVIAVISFLLVIGIVSVAPSDISALAQQKDNKTAVAADDPITDIAGEASSIDTERSSNNAVILIIGALAFSSVGLALWRLYSNSKKLESFESEDSEY